jgi:hypothetical protein
VATTKRVKEKAFDLDAASAARREKLGKGPKIKWAGKMWQLPPEIPFEVSVAARFVLDGEDEDEQERRGGAALAEIAEALFGDRFKEFLGTRPAVLDVLTLAQNLDKVYGQRASLGESRASES